MNLEVRHRCDGEASPIGTVFARELPDGATEVWCGTGWLRIDDPIASLEFMDLQRDYDDLLRRTIGLRVGERRTNGGNVIQ